MSNRFGRKRKAKLIKKLEAEFDDFLAYDRSINDDYWNEKLHRQKMQFDQETIAIRKMNETLLNHKVQEEALRIKPRTIIIEKED